MNDLATRLAPYAASAGEAVSRALRAIEPATLREAASHYPDAGGKRLRPVFSLLAAEAVGGRAEEAMPFAVAVELVHNFSLVHDDIMDADDLRRGRPTVHRRWDEATAILAGDALLALAFEGVAKDAKEAKGAKDALAELSEAIRLLCEGQSLDMAFEKEKSVAREAYLRMIYGKTARLFEASARGGAILAGAHPIQRDALGQFGRAFGMAFQIHDDLLDLTQTTAALGKPAFSDLKRGKRTLVAIEGFERARAPERAAIDRAFGNPKATEADLAAAFAAYEATGAIRAARAEVERQTDSAKVALSALPPSPARDLLAALAGEAATRSH